MLREIITIIVIILLICSGEYVMSKYTSYATDTMISMLEEINIENDSSSAKISEINEKWDEIKIKMAYYIEHNELEKVENNLKSIESAIEIDDGDDGEIYINQCKYMLKHIKEKYEFNLQNIF